MYKRNITHILTPVAVILLVFIGFHAWFKPNYLPTPPTPPPQPQEAEEKDDRAADPGMKNDQSAAESKQVRVIDPGEVPDSKHVSALNALREELEKGNTAAVESKLSDLSPRVLAEKQARRYIAVLWNNLGVQQERVGGTEVSVKAFKTAVSIDPSNPVAHLNLAHAYWELRDPALTEEFLHKLIRLAPTEPFPHLAMADLLQEKDDLGAAAKHLDHASDRAQQDPALRSYLQTVTTKVRRTEKAEQHMIARDSAHFMVKFDGAEDNATWTGVLDILEDAYRDIGQKFGHYPSKTVIVILHTKDNFQGATGSPLWADGLFDPVLGRIQVPVQGALTDRVWLTRVLRHEFVHALLHDQMGVNTGLLPNWLNEGLAMQLAGDPWPDLEQVIHPEMHLIPLASLEGGWGNLTTDAAAVAYLEANSATHYLIDRFGMYRLREVLSLLRARQSMAAAMQDKFLVSYDQFQKQWAETLNAKVKSGKT